MVCLSQTANKMIFDACVLAKASGDATKSRNSPRAGCRPSLGDFRLYSRSTYMGSEDPTVIVLKASGVEGGTDFCTITVLFRPRFQQNPGASFVRSRRGPNMSELKARAVANMLKIMPNVMPVSTLILFNGQSGQGGI